MNPMIMLSGEDGSASHSNISTVNLTSLTTIGGSNQNPIGNVAQNNSHTRAKSGGDPT